MPDTPSTPAPGAPDDTPASIPGDLVRVAAALLGYWSPALGCRLYALATRIDRSIA